MPKRPALAMMLVLACLGTARGQPGSGAALTLREAAAAIDVGEHERAQALALSVLQAADAQKLDAAAAGVMASGPPATFIDRQDRAEAWRLYGLALFFSGQPERAEHAFFEYLKLDYEGRLDPALVPPEAVVFFAEVRSRHAAALRAFRPVPARKRRWALNLLPPAGQLQNRQPVKAWVLAGAGTVLLATNLATYAVLQRWCDATTGVCGDGDGQSSAATGRLVRAVNLGSGALLVAVVAYGMIDGLYYYRQDRTARSSTSRPDTTLGIAPASGGAYVFIQGRL